MSGKSVRQKRIIVQEANGKYACRLVFVAAGIWNCYNVDIRN